MDNILRSYRLKIGREDLPRLAELIDETGFPKLEIPDPLDPEELPEELRDVIWVPPPP